MHPCVLFLLLRLIEDFYCPLWKKRKNIFFCKFVFEKTVWRNEILTNIFLFPGDENMIGENSYKYLTVDEMKSLGDDSMPIDVTHDEKQHTTTNTQQVTILWCFSWDTLVCHRWCQMEVEQSNSTAVEMTQNFLIFFGPSIRSLFGGPMEGYQP